MFAIFARMTVDPDRIDEFKAAVEADRAASLRDEPGCLAFEVHQVRGEANEFALYEHYVDEEAFTVGHCEAPHYADWQAAVPNFVVEHTTNIITLDPVPWESETDQSG